MTYSLTERKRIRKSFAKRANVQPVPFLLATQLESYTAFLQAHVAPESRRNWLSSETLVPENRTASAAPAMRSRSRQWAL